MVDDILDKIIVPNGKSSKGDVFKKEGKKEHYKEEKKEKPKESVKPKTKHHIYEKKKIFHKKEFRRPVSFNIKTPGLIERGIFIAIILILFYFAFFQNININLDLGNIFGGEVQPLVVKETETEETELAEEETTETAIEETEEETELTGEIIFTVDDVKTEKYDTGVSKITGFTFTIDNQKEEVDATLKYYGYDGYTPTAWVTKERGEETYSIIPIGKNTYNVDTSIVFTNTYDKTMRFELISDDEAIANLTKEVAIS